MSKIDEPEWMLNLLRQLDCDGKLIKRSPLDPPPPPVRVEDIAAEYFRHESGPYTIDAFYTEQSPQ